MAAHPVSSVDVEEHRRHVSRAEGPTEQEDAKQALTVMLALLQRERARADQFYTRARNLLAYTTALFTGVQIAFLAALGRETKNGDVLVTAPERHDVATAAVVALGALIIAVAVLSAGADRSQRTRMVSGEDVLRTMAFPPRGLSAVQALVGRLADEEDSWATVNNRRSKLNLVLAVLCGVVAVAALIELVLLYTALS